MTGILVVGGYGVVGRRIAADLAPDHPDGVLVSGRHLDRAEATAASIGHGARGRRIDVTSPSSIEAALADVSVVVNCVDQPERCLLRAAIERSLAYADITPHLTTLGRGAAYERVDAAARATGARILLGTGLVPGISSVMVRALADEIGGSDRIETALLLSADDLTGPGSTDFLLQELTMRFDIHVDGVDRPARPFTSPRVVDYPPPLGPRPAYLFPFSDQVLYPRTMGARTAVTRLSVDPPRMRRLLAMLVRTGGARIAARPRVRSAVAGLVRRRTTDAGAPYALRVDVHNAGRAMRATLTGRGQAFATASGAAATVRSLAAGEIQGAGAWMPEQVIDPSRFLDRLAGRGLHVETAGGSGVSTA